MKKTIRDLTLADKRVFIRADFNVPLDANGNITDDTRIQKTLPTIRYVLAQGGAVILASHLGRPKGEVQATYSLKPVADRLSQLLGKPVQMAPDCIGAATEAMAHRLQGGEILLLENLRFHKEEEANDPQFSRALAALAEVGVNDAFGCCHRAHASVAGITAFLPMAAGLLLAKEIQFIGGAVTQPAHPFAAIIGGAKVSDKIGVLANLLQKVEVLMIGGGMANTFLAAQGLEIGTSLVEIDKIPFAASLLHRAEQAGVQVLLPTDVVVAEAVDNTAAYDVVSVQRVPSRHMILDIGPQTCKTFAARLQGMKLIVWNGPMGVFELSHFSHGTTAVARAVAASEAVSIVGGGDSVAAVNQCGVAEHITHISTGGGASLAYLEGKDLPGIAALQDA